MATNALRSQHAVITGASRGIGKSIALKLIACGVNVALVGRDTESLEKGFRDVQANGTKIVLYRTDLTQDAEIRSLAAELQSKHSAIDILIHSAGIIRFGSLDLARIEDFDEQYKCNVRAPYLLTQLLLPSIKQRKGQIVFINSSIVLHTRAGVGQFSATQHALQAVTDSLREEVNGHGVRVLSIFPGRTATPRQENIYKTEQRSYKPELLLQPDDIAEMVASALTLPRTAEVTNLHIRPLEKSY